MKSEETLCGSETQRSQMVLGKRKTWIETVVGPGFKFNSPLSCPIRSKDVICMAGDTFSSVQLLSCVQIFASSWTAARLASLSITNSQSLLKFMYIQLVMRHISSIQIHAFRG